MGSPRVATMPPAHNLRPRTAESSISNTNGVAKAERNTGNPRTYEDDVDYVLEKDTDAGIKGPERKPLVGVDNYGEVYSEKISMEEPTPYHTRYDSKPFSYIRQNPSVPTSKNVSRCSSREAIDGGRGRGLESPSLLRKVIGVAQAELDTPPASRHLIVLDLLLGTIPSLLTRDSLLLLLHQGRMISPCHLQIHPLVKLI